MITVSKGGGVPSASLTIWHNERMPRLDQVDAHCASVAAMATPNSTFLDETLRGYVLHLSAHFQGFCNGFYNECTQFWKSAIPIEMRATAQAQFRTQLALEKGNPTYENIKRDFNRFGILLDLQHAHPLGSQRITDLGHLNAWRNKAAHQSAEPLGAGIPGILTLSMIQQWKESCDGIASSLDEIMYREMSRIMSFVPW